MGIINTFELVGLIEIRGKLGRPNECGAIECGWSRLGEYMPEAGIYQKCRSNGEQKFKRLKFYRPTNPQTAPQQANRSKFALAVQAYQALTPEEKKAWRALKYPRFMSGYNRFLREFMRDMVQG